MLIQISHLVASVACRACVETSFPPVKRHCACERTYFPHPRGYVSRPECPLHHKETCSSKNKEQQHSVGPMSKTCCSFMLAGCLAFLSISTVSTLALIPAVPATSETSLALWNFSSLAGVSSTLANTTNTTNSSPLLGDRVIHWHCETDTRSRAYGRSCFEAVRQMAIVPGSASRQFKWGPRSQGFYDVPLPQRVISRMRSPIFAPTFQLTKKLSSRRTLFDPGEGGEKLAQRNLRAREPTAGTKWCGRGDQQMHGWSNARPTGHSAEFQ